MPSPLCLHLIGHPVQRQAVRLIFGRALPTSIKKENSTVIWRQNKHDRFSRDKDGHLSIWEGPPEQLNVFKQRGIGK